MSEIPDCTDQHWSSRVDLGDEMAILFYADGTARFRHRCDRTAQDRGVIYCSPALQLDGGHVIVCVEPLTISPSILCSDCGTHGFVRDGEWSSC